MSPPTLRPTYLLSGLFFLLNPFALATYFAAQPEPFRGNDEILLRTFEFENKNYLHKLSFRVLPEDIETFEQGLLISNGSTTTREFLSLMSAQKSFHTPSKAVFSFDYQRNEDFDGRYERTLMHMGYPFNDNWTAHIGSDFSPTKENLDVHWTLKYARQNNRLRVVFVQTDYVMDQKSKTRTYDRQPYTAFADYRWSAGERWLFSGHLNVNSPLKLKAPDLATDFTYWQHSGEFKFRYAPGNQFTIHGQINGEHGKRTWNNTPYGVTNSADFLRDFAQATLETRHQWNNRLTLIYGISRIRLYEHFNNDTLTPQNKKVSRHERLFFAGGIWPINPSLQVAPILYASKLDNYFLAGKDTSTTVVDDNLIAKIALPFTWLLKNNSKISVNATQELDEWKFGGLNFMLNFSADF